MTLEETFERLGLEQIERYLQERAQEHLQLEFKALKNSFLDRDDRKIFARCISGFANSSGGIIVWGVDARAQDGVDCACERKEIEQLEQFVSKLNEFTGQAVSPVADGIRHKAIETKGGRGFAATIVPESDSGPHMAKLGEDRYYKRSGTSFLKMEHFDLEDMFGRRPRPKLVPKVVHIPARAEANGQEQLEFSIDNIGRAVAKFPGFFALMTNIKITRVHNLRNTSDANQGKPSVQYDNNTGVIHPHGITTFIGNLSFQREDAHQPVTVEVTIYCENMPTQTFHFPPFD